MRRLTCFLHIIDTCCRTKIPTLDKVISDSGCNVILFNISDNVSLQHNGNKILFLFCFYSAQLRKLVFFHSSRKLQCFPPLLPHHGAYTPWFEQIPGKLNSNPRLTLNLKRTCASFPGRTQRVPGRDRSASSNSSSLWVQPRAAALLRAPGAIGGGMRMDDHPFLLMCSNILVFVFV